jgi:hypothetical protein
MVPLRAARAVALWLLVLLPREARAAELRPETERAWENYLTLTEARISREIASGEAFLVRDFLPAEVAGQAQETVSGGGVFVHQMETRNEEGREIDIPSGIVHHWYGTVFVPGATLEEVLRWEQDYARHQDYFDEVEASRLVSREGDVFRIFLRLQRTKVITVHYNTEHLVAYSHHGPDRATSKSEATHIGELEDAGTPREREKRSNQDRGFLWRLNSYWRFKNEADGIIVECESISLSRDVPRGVAWMVQSFLESVPKESLENTLLPIRTHLSRPKTAGER